MNELLINKNITRIILVIYAFSVFVNGSFYMCWNTYPIRTLSFLVQFISYAAVVPLIWLVIKNGEWKLNQWIIMGMCSAIVLEITSNLLGSMYTSKIQIRLLLNIFIILSLKDEYRSQIFTYMLRIFAIMLLPCLIYYILGFLGIELPYQILYGVNESKTAAGVYYKHYLLGVVISGSPGRYCGVFDEPGVVGTYAALLFAGSLDKRKNKFAWLVFLEGMFSLSMAFYVMVFVYIVVKLGTKGIYKSVLLGIICVIGLVIFVNINFESPALTMIQSRIDFSSGFGVKDNRTSDEFEKFYQEFWENRNYEVALGDGRTILDHLEFPKGSSYKMLFVRYGVIGVLLLVLFYAMLIRHYRISKANLPFIVVFFASVYQRPYIFSIFYVCIFMATLSNIEQRKQLYIKVVNRK